MIRLNKPDLERLIKLGYGLEEIAEKCECSPQTIRNRLKMYGLEAKTKRQLQRVRETKELKGRQKSAILTVGSADHFPDETIKILAAAVLIQGVKDYQAIMQGRKIPKETKNSLEKWFKGEWAKGLRDISGLALDPEAALKMVKSGKIEMVNITR